jgi:serine/threonine-protein kinase RsbW
MAMAHVEKTYRLQIKSLPENINKVEPFLTGVNADAGLDEVEFNKLIVATTEAVNNAILHGNRSDPGKSVTVAVDIRKQYLVVQVCDEGGGFDPDSVENPLKDENLLKESGRGLFLMKTLMEEVDVRMREDGCEVRMALYIGPKTGLQNTE